MGKSTEAIGLYLNHLFCNLAWTNIGDAAGLLASAGAGNLYISLHTADPGAAGDQTTSEAAYPGYARVAVVRSAGLWTVAAPQVSNASSILFPACTSSTETETYWGVGTDQTGAGHLIYSGPITSLFYGFTAAVDDTITIPGSAFNVDDRIAFYKGSADWPFPTGITQSALYFVKTAVADVITISTTSGGATVNVTVAGAGACAILTPFAVSSGVVPAVATGSLVIIEG